MPISTIALMTFSKAALTDPPIVYSAGSGAGTDRDDIDDAGFDRAQVRPGGAGHPHITVKFQCESILPVFFCQREEVCAFGCCRIVHPRSRRSKCPTACAMACAGAAGSRRSAEITWISILAVLTRVAATSGSFAGSRATRQRGKDACLLWRVRPLWPPRYPGWHRLPVQLSARFKFHFSSLTMLWGTMPPRRGHAIRNMSVTQRSIRKFIKRTMALLAELSYIARTGFQERNIWQKMCWASRPRS
jgi:hypothetical protein